MHGGGTCCMLLHKLPRAASHAGTWLMLQVVGMRLARHVLKNQDKLIAGITSVTHVEDDVKVSLNLGRPCCRHVWSCVLISLTSTWWQLAVACTQCVALRLIQLSTHTPPGHIRDR